MIIVNCIKDHPSIRSFDCCYYYFYLLTPCSSEVDDGLMVKYQEETSERTALVLCNTMDPITVLIPLSSSQSPENMHEKSI